MAFPGLGKGQPTILLVDSDLQALSRYASLLVEMGFFNHLQAENGSEALSLAGNQKFDLIIARQDTPILSGLALLKLIRQQESIADEEAVFVLYGENLGPRILAQAGRAGARSVIMTPCENEYFKARLNEAIQPPAGPQEEKAGELFVESRRLEEAGELEKAVEKAQSILELPENAEIYYNMGYIKTLKEQYEEALACFRRATAINSRHAKAFQQIGLIYKKMGRPQEALTHLERAGQIHLESRQDTEAEEIFKVVLTLRPGTTNVYNSLSIIYRRQGRLIEAARTYEKAILVHPDDEHVRFNAARVHYELKNYSKARQALERALQINPKFSEAGKLLKVVAAALAER